jgi:hypothetical protein
MGVENLDNAGLTSIIGIHDSAVLLAVLAPEKLV